MRPPSTFIFQDLTFDEFVEKLRKVGCQVENGPIRQQRYKGKVFESMSLTISIECVDPFSISFLSKEEGTKQITFVYMELFQNEDIWTVLLQTLFAPIIFLLWLLRMYDPSPEVSQTELTYAYVHITKALRTDTRFQGTGFHVGPF